MGEGHSMGPAVARRRAAFGVIALGLRTAAVQICALAGMVVLARVMAPQDLGLLAVLQFALTFFQFFGDAGVGAALIQSRQAPSERALASVFTLQMSLATAVVAAVWLASPLLHGIWPALPRAAPAVLRAMSLAFLLTGFRVVPSILLERDLRFGVIAAGEVAQTAAFYLVASACAVGGLREWTWPAATLAQALAGFVVVFAAHPWRPRLALDWALLRPLVRFGATYQLKAIVGFTNNAVTPLYAGAALGPAAVGLVGWAQQVAYLPLRLVEVMGRVAFPLFARLQSDRRALAGVFERALQLCAVGVFFTTALFLTAGVNITVVVFSERWLGGLLALYAFSAVLVLGFVSPVVGAVLDALGRPGIIARLATLWTLLNWIVVPFTTARWGFTGFVAGYCVHVVVGNLAVLYVLRRLVPEVRLLRPLAGPALGALGVAAVGWLALRPWATTPVRLALGVAAALVVHLGLFALVDRQAILEARRLFRTEGAGG